MVIYAGTYRFMTASTGDDDANIMLEHSRGAWGAGAAAETGSPVQSGQN